MKPDEKEYKNADLPIFTWLTYESCVVNVFSIEATASRFRVLLLFNCIVAKLSVKASWARLWKITPS